MVSADLVAQEYGTQEWATSCETEAATITLPRNSMLLAHNHKHLRQCQAGI
jgi:hypothetical protein